MFQNQKRELLQKLMKKASQEGMYLISRLEDTHSKSINLDRKGKVENSQVNLYGGVGLQVFTPRGYHACGGCEGLDSDEALHLLSSLIRAAHQAERVGMEPAPQVFDLDPTKVDDEPERAVDMEGLSIDELKEKIQGVHRPLSELDNKLIVRSSTTVKRRNWLIGRSDGTEVSFVQPYVYRKHSLIHKDKGQTRSKGVNGYGPDLDIFDEDYLPRVQSTAQTLAALHAAPTLPPGNYPLVIDYALAKGLAHEAFGHAAEGDRMESSILSDQGRFAQGRKVADQRVTIIDESIEGDNAYQPFSPNGVLREPVTIIENGVLKEALSDVFSASKIGTPPRGCSRIQSYRHPPMPRMSNIRLEFEGAEEMDMDFDQVTPGHLRSALEKSGIFQEHEEVVYISGYRGGQVNTTLGNFVFGCVALYRLTAQGEELFQPAIFSGDCQNALQAVKNAYGPLQLDALGTCGKAGQKVPSSGGSHYFLYMQPDPQIVLGGQSDDSEKG